MATATETLKPLAERISSHTYWELPWTGDRPKSALANNVKGGGFASARVRDGKLAIFRGCGGNERIYVSDDAYAHCRNAFRDFFLRQKPVREFFEDIHPTTGRTWNTRRATFGAITFERIEAAQEDGSVFFYATTITVEPDYAFLAQTASDGWEYLHGLSADAVVDLNPFGD